MTIIEQLKAEIERLKIQVPRSAEADGYNMAIDDMLKIIEEKSEKPTVQEGLEKEIETQVYGHFFDLNGIAIAGATAYATVDDMAYIARHFAEWGAEHLKK